LCFYAILGTTLLGRYLKVDPRWHGPDGESGHQVDQEEKGATINVGSEEQDADAEKPDGDAAN
jgi:hypothetical protein